MGKLLHRIRTISFVLLIISSIAAPGKLFGQGKFSVSGGFSLPELLNGSVLYQLKQSQIGLNIGFYPKYSYKYIPLSAIYYYHFAGSSEFSTLRPWYGKSGLMYLVDEDQYMLDKSLYIPLLLGRNFNMSMHFGLNLEIGLAFLIYNDNTIKEYHEYPYGSPEVGSTPSGGFAFFYRF
jgi:hypothetical protein